MDIMTIMCVPQVVRCHCHRSGEPLYAVLGRPGNWNDTQRPCQSWSDGRKGLKSNGYDAFRAGLPVERHNFHTPSEEW